MQYLILYVLLIAICLPNVKINNYKEENVSSIMSKVNLLRGVFAIFIIYTHCSMAFDPLPIMLFPLRKVSTFGVGFFFAISGYGLAYSFGTKPNYLDGFLTRKLSKIIILALVSRVVSMIALSMFIGSEFTLVGIVRYMNWYVYSLIMLYIIFYVVYSNLHKRSYRTIGIWVAIITLTFMLLLFNNIVTDIGRSYYISQWAFAIGITIYEYREEIDCLKKNHFFSFNFIMVVLLCATFGAALKGKEYTILDLVSHNLMLLPFFYFVMVICKYFSFNNPVLRFLNKISFEIYLYQFMCIAIIKATLPEFNVAYFLLSVVSTIVVAWGINTIIGMIPIKKKHGTR